VSFVEWRFACAAWSAAGPQTAAHQRDEKGTHADRPHAHDHTVPQANVRAGYRMNVESAYVHPPGSFYLIHPANSRSVRKKPTAPPKNANAVSQPRFA
jgi:hypothetical protein